MIPYDELVAALQAWRARQGLPVSTPQQAPGAQAVSNANATHQSPRPGTPPPAPPARTTKPRMPLPLAPVDTADEHLDSLEVDESLHMVEDHHYENEGDDFAMAFGGNGGNGHGHTPAAPNGATADETLVGDDVTPEPTDPARSHSRNDDW